MGKVYLVGAGPGIAELITVRGLTLIRNCDAIIYDRLAGETLLSEVSEQCEKVYVGKEPGSHAMAQEEINALLIDYAGRYETVVRLKGGDPFVFGRGEEELSALRQAGIPCEVVPGISSCIAVPELAEIPVTARGISREFAVITGHAAGYTPDYENLAAFQGTLVFLMGLARISEIADGLIRYGKSADTPAAVIQLNENEYAVNRTCTVIRADLASIAGRVQEEGIPSPVIILVGETASYHADAHMNQVLEKSRIRVGITATKTLAAKLCSGFRAAEIEAVVVCDMQVVHTADHERLAELSDSMEKYDCIVFTSENGVRLFFEAIRGAVDYRSFGRVRFAVIGTGTADALRKQGFVPDLMPKEYTVEALTDLLQQEVRRNEKVLVIRAAQGSKVLTEGLALQEIGYDEYNIYDVKGELTENSDHLDSLDYLLFASSSGVSAFYGGLTAEQGRIAKRIPVVAIGRETAKAIHQYGGTLAGIAKYHDTAGLLELIQTITDSNIH